MIKIKEAIIVEGRYDKIRLASLFDTAIIETGGFRVFKDGERKHVIRTLARARGIVVLTDSDGAGFVIRNFLKGIVTDSGLIKNAYVPDIKGKESRKAQPSKQGLLGVEGMTDEIIIKAVISSGAEVIGEENTVVRSEITKLDFYNWGLTGRENSSQIRAALLKKLGFPQYMTSNALLDAVRLLYTSEELDEIMEDI
ncbi:MAG: DUF4093 domain-containing protein [Lachnospiraceae bacterium]|nr:DUF4093 domain-containing protein [Lachnospiraceae bacterium]